jgi:hypothetical protein
MEIVLRYDGPDLAAHYMGAEEFGEALVALSNLIQLSNRKLNGEGAKIRVLVNAEVDQNCFQIIVRIIEIAQSSQTLLEHITIEQLADWIGLTRDGVSLFKTLIRLGQDIKERRRKDPGGSDPKFISPDSLKLPENTPPQTRSLLEDPHIVRLAQTVLKPASLKGYDKVGFYKKTGTPYFEATGSEVADAMAVTGIPRLYMIEDPQSHDLGSNVGFAYVQTSHFEGSAKWRLKWGGRTIYAKMPQAFLEEFQNNEIIVIPNTKMLCRISTTPKLRQQRGNPEAEDYVVEEVLELELPPRTPIQTSLL